MVAYLILRGNNVLIWQEVTWALWPGFCPLLGEVRTRLTLWNEDKRTTEWRYEENRKARGSQTEPEGKDRAGLRLSVMGFLQSSLKRHEDLHTCFFCPQHTCTSAKYTGASNSECLCVCVFTMCASGFLIIVLRFWTKRVRHSIQHLVAPK